MSSVCNCTSQPSVDKTLTSAQVGKHPCYASDAHQLYARMHLPVAPRCNISCNYCNRKFDCVNESRPGVTSEILSPTQAQAKFELVNNKIDNLTVVGIAGPGDALANWSACRETIQLIKDKRPDLHFCLSTNGLMLPDYARELVELGVSHVTVTVNCLDPDIGAQIYRHIWYNGISCAGPAAAVILRENQLFGIDYLSAQGILVKVNIVMIKDLNDSHIPEVVKAVKAKGAAITNIMPLIPAAGSQFAHHVQTSARELKVMQEQCSKILPQMRHCRQCRADAIGLLAEDRSLEFSQAALGRQDISSLDSVAEATKKVQENLETAATKLVAPHLKKQYTIAVTSKNGKLIDLHFGHADEFAIYRSNGGKFTLLEIRSTEKYCLGMDECDTDNNEKNRRDRILSSLADCDALLTMRIGHAAQKRLLKQGVISLEYCYTLESGLQYALEQLQGLKQQSSAS